MDSFANQRMYLINGAVKTDVTQKLKKFNHKVPANHLFLNYTIKNIG
jgi:hypothetical protein